VVERLTHSLKPGEKACAERKELKANGFKTENPQD
jgi:hypothetical protein